MPEKRRSVAQSTLDELFRKGLLPFRLIAYRIETHGDECVVQFYDSRLHSVAIDTRNGNDFTDLFRKAVLDKVKNMTPARIANSTAN